MLIYNDYGRLFFEKYVRSMHYNLILDFDDDLEVAKMKTTSPSFFAKALMFQPDKFKYSLRYYHKFIVGSNYLKTSPDNETA